MRKQLATSVGERKKFRATFVRFGKKMNYHGYSQETVLLRDITDLEINKIVAEHVWFAYSKKFQQIPLVEGVRIEFEARVKKYTKGYKNARYKIDQRKEDYKLSNPTKVVLKEEG